MVSSPTLDTFVKQFGGSFPLTLNVAVKRLVDEVGPEGHCLELDVETRGNVRRSLRLRLVQPGRLTLFVTGMNGNVCEFEALTLTQLPQSEDWDLFRYQLDGAQLDEEINVKFHALEVLSNTPLDRE